MPQIGNQCKSMANTTGKTTITTALLANTQWISGESDCLKQCNTSHNPRFQLNETLALIQQVNRTMVHFGEKKRNFVREREQR